jgi:hypothetical protein
VRCDANLADLDRLFAEVRHKKDHVDVLFANASLLSRRHARCATKVAAIAIVGGFSG